MTAGSVVLSSALGSCVSLNKLVNYLISLNLSFFIYKTVTVKIKGKCTNGPQLMIIQLMMFQLQWKKSKMHSVETTL
jgi:hypothetical protein